MRLAIFGTFLISLLSSLGVAADNPASALWTELKDKRDKLPFIHQEFEVSRTYTVQHGSTQSAKWENTIDIVPGMWKERVVRGSGNLIEIFDGGSILRVEEGGDEYIRTPIKKKEADPVPAAYRFPDSNWSKATEVQRGPCGFPPPDHQCVVFDIPIKPWIHKTNAVELTTMNNGMLRAMVDLQNGLLIFSRTIEGVDRPRAPYKSDVTYRMKHELLNATPNANLFDFPLTDLQEVKKFSPWRAARIRKMLSGKPAPELDATDLGGNPVSLEAFRGKTVLLDFWATWCPPCRADAPALDKLYKKYGGKEVEIVGVSVNEDREIVEKYLKKAPHSFPIILTPDNDLPRPYQVQVMPTYIVIDKDGNVTAAVEGDHGFSELRELLKKAGMETE